VRATAFEYKMDQFSHGISGGNMLGSRKGISGGHGSQKTYKRGSGSMGTNNGSSSGLRPGTASQKRPASPNTQGKIGLGSGHGNGPSPYSFGLVQQHNNLIGGHGMQ
jgi:hypothetical protein